MRHNVERGAFHRGYTGHGKYGAYRITRDRSSGWWTATIATHLIKGTPHNALAYSRRTLGEVAEAIEKGE